MGKKADRPNWRDVSRICLPGVLLDQTVNRAVQAVLNPLVLAGPNIAQKLERRIERQGDTSSLSLARRLLRGAVLWLLEAPNSEPEATELAADPELAWLADALEQRGSRQETHMPLLPGAEVLGQRDPSSVQARRQELHGSSCQNAQGVH